MKTKNIIKVIKDPSRLLYHLVCRYPSIIKDDRKYIEFIWRYRMTYPLNLQNPKTYNEKLQWMKLYDRNEIYTTMVDKLEAKNYVSKIIGTDYIIPTIRVWQNVDDINIDSLPEQFVMKTTHDSGGIVICKDKGKFDIERARSILKKSLQTDFYMAAREWPYKNVPRRIIVEKYMEDQETKELRDYKFFCFDGEVKALFVATGRQTREEPFFDFFDPNYNHLDLRHGHPNSPITPQKPTQFFLMKKLAEKLSSGFPHLRVDFYEVNGRVYFGELTLFHHTGMEEFDPPEWDYVFGNYLHLPI